MERMNLHYSDDLIEDYSQGRLAEDQSSAFEEHLLMCVECQTRLAQFDEYRVVARTAARELGNTVAKSRIPWLSWLPQSGGLLKMGMGTALALALLAVALPIAQRGGPDENVYLTATRGLGPLLSQANAGHRLLLTIDIKHITGAAQYQVQVVNSSGAVVADWSGAPNEDRLMVPVDKKLAGGKYWVRVHDAANRSSLLAEYGMELRG
jgi:hypothetical protein